MYIDNFLSRMGLISYSTYLLHLMILSAISRSGLTEFIKHKGIYYSLFQVFVIEIPIILIVSYFSFVYIEKPFLDLRKKYFQIDP